MGFNHLTMKAFSLVAYNGAHMIQGRSVSLLEENCTKSAPIASKACYKRVKQDAGEYHPQKY